MIATRDGGSSADLANSHGATPAQTINALLTRIPQSGNILGSLWYYTENFDHEQGREHAGYVTESYPSALARQVPGLNLALWTEDRRDPFLVGKVAENEQAAYAARFGSTPSHLVGRTRAIPIHRFDQFALDLAAVNQALRQTLNSEQAHDQWRTQCIHAPDDI